MEVEALPGCCGIREICGLSRHRSAKIALKALKRQVYQSNSYYPDHSRFRYAIFSQAGRCSRYGFRFAALIRESNLGEVIQTGTHVNPNSGNLLRVFVWAVDHDAVKRWSGR